MCIKNFLVRNTVLYCTKHIIYFLFIFFTGAPWIRSAGGGPLPVFLGACSARPPCRPCRRSGPAKFGINGGRGHRHLNAVSGHAFHLFSCMGGEGQKTNGMCYYYYYYYYYYLFYFIY